ncbi:hypothetical protein LI221_15235 [Faecalimonas umbilicata]|nr:hypothetical protein [Faecalimonas umbilicata]
MIFENRFKTTEEMYKEYVYKVLCRGILVQGVIFSVIAGLTIPMVMGQSGILAAVEGVCLLILICVMVFVPRQTLKQLLKQQKRLHGGEFPESVISFGEDIQIVEGRQQMHFEYSLVERFYHLKTCNVLMIGKENGILYVPGAFTVGNPEEFEKFILMNCKNLKRIEKR